MPATAARTARYHAHLSSAAAGRCRTARLLRPPDGRPQDGRLVYAHATRRSTSPRRCEDGPYRHSNLAAAVARCAAAADPSAVCLEDFAPYVPSRRRADRLHGGAGDRPGRRDRRAGRAIVDRGDRQGRDRRPAAGARRASAPPARPTSSGPTSLLRSGSRAFYETRRPLLRRAEAGGEPAEEIDAIRRYGTPVLHQQVDTERHRAALAGIEGTGEIIGYRGTPDARLVGAAGHSRRQVGADRQDRHRRGVRADRQAAAGPDDRRRPRAAGGDR